MARRIHWDREKCLAYLDCFIQNERRYPRMDECTPRHGLPSDTAFRAYIGSGILRYCREHYPEYAAGQTHRPGRSVLDTACGLWCETLAEHPERASGVGFSMFYKALMAQERQKDLQEADTEPQIGGMTHGG